MKKLLTNGLGKSQRAERKSCVQAFRPRFELLEDRSVPATFKVTTFADIVDPSDGKLALREAITMANATTRPDTIKLKAGEYKLAIAGAYEDNNATGDFDLTNPVTFKGKGMSATFIDGGGLDRLFEIHDTYGIVFSNLTKRNEAVPPLGGGVVYLDMGTTGDGPNTQGDCDRYADLANEIQQEIDSVGTANDTDLLLAVVLDDVVNEAMDGGCFVVYKATPPRPLNNGSVLTQLQNQLGPLANWTASTQRDSVPGITDAWLVGLTNNAVVYLEMGSTGQGPNTDGDCGTYGDLANGIEDAMNGLEMVNQFGDRLPGTFNTEEDADMYDNLSQLRDEVISEGEDGGCFVVYMASPPRPVFNGSLLTQFREQLAIVQRGPLAGIPDTRHLAQFSSLFMEVEG